jgi:hypothetical protein
VVFGAYELPSPGETSCSVSPPSLGVDGPGGEGGAVEADVSDDVGGCVGAACHGLG